MREMTCIFNVPAMLMSFSLCVLSCFQPMMPFSRGLEPFLLELWGPVEEYKFVSECKNRQAEWWGGIFWRVRGGSAYSPSHVSECSRVLRQLLSGEFPISTFLSLLFLLSSRASSAFYWTANVQWNFIVSPQWSSALLCVLSLRQIWIERKHCKPTHQFDQ